MATTEEERVQQVLDNIRWANEACQQYGWNPRTKKIEPMNSYIDPDMGWVSGVKYKFPLATTIFTVYW